jgi:hypothetical protein
MEPRQARARRSQSSTQGIPICFKHFDFIFAQLAYQAPGNLSVGEAVAIGLLGAEGVLFFCAGEVVGRGRCSFLFELSFLLVFLTIFTSFIVYAI